jgi:hypothetical protein
VQKIGRVKLNCLRMELGLAEVGRITRSEEIVYVRKVMWLIKTGS